MVKVSFVIRTLNEVSSIGKVISLINGLKGDFSKEIVIVDSGSTDGTVEVVSEHENVVLLKVEPKDWSWGYSLNLGVARAIGDYIVIISGHCYISEESFLEKSISLLEQNHKVAAVYGQQKPIDNFDPFEEWELFSWYPNMSLHIMDNPKSLIGVSNACCVLKKEAWKLNSFDEEAQSMEDGIWAVSIINAGWSLIYSSDIGVYHSHKFDPQYIYRKWFSRTLQGLLFAEDIYKKEIRYKLKKKIKFYLLPAITTVSKNRENYQIKKFLSDRAYIDESDIHAFLNLKYLAITNAQKAFVKGDKVNYWDVEIDKFSLDKLTKLKDIINV